MLGLDPFSIIGTVGEIGNVAVAQGRPGGAGVSMFSIQIGQGSVCPGSTTWLTLVLFCCMALLLSSMLRSIGAAHCSGS